jgi:hypothetical protein
MHVRQAFVIITAVAQRQQVADGLLLTAMALTTLSLAWLAWVRL